MEFLTFLSAPGVAEFDPFEPLSFNGRIDRSIAKAVTRSVPRAGLVVPGHAGFQHDLNKEEREIALCEPR
jgi:hypothetical protein